ncbi:type II toxin-antitoxin system HipA family toxin [Hydrocarboniphaga sp.]|uniref:type II toxin-antitoxin system HipA family toxin n=1 Tax=Hydrocarboniphaga sp. TaxID=2033016 RepID=UPI002630D75A|nr:type II toxin-antitoxin system HipA family toxin [Hydrocarboniphaga sp.]
MVCGRLFVEGERLSFIYGRSYRARAEAIPLMPERMPLAGGPFSARRDGQLPGPIADAAPDAWGRHVIEYRHQAGGFAELDYLRLSHGDRIGALHFQSSAKRYIPSVLAPATLADLLSAADALEREQPLPPELANALEHGSSIGGARPKATLRDGRRALIAKFASATDRWAIVRAEWACLRLARRCGIPTPDAWVDTVLGKDVLLVERFDRRVAGDAAADDHDRQPVPADTLRYQMLSALTLLDLDDTEASLASYPELAELLRRLAQDGVGDARQLFRRMVFNLLIGNTDDHAKNHAAFWDGRWLRLTPAYDLVPALRLGQEARQAMAVGREGRASTLANALSEAGRFGLLLAEAEAIVDEVETTLAQHWKTEFADCGVPQTQITQLDGRAVLSPVARQRRL